MMSVKEIWKNHDKYINEELMIRGRIVTHRSGASNTIQFINICDGSTVKTLQCVYNGSIANISKGTTLMLSGKLITSQGKGQAIELSVSSYQIYGQVNPLEYPLAGKSIVSRDYLRTIPHLRHHTLLFTAIQCIKQTVYKAFHEGMSTLNIGEIQPTLITSNECEGGSFPFSVLVADGKGNKKDFFDKPTFLTVSSQLHLEATVCGTLKDSYCMTTAFRAEPSKGPLHLAEFCMPEWESIGDIDKNMEITEKVLKHCFKCVLEDCNEELLFLEKYRLDDIKNNHLEQVKIHKDKKSKMKKKDWLLEKDKIEATINTDATIFDRLNKYVEKPFTKVSHADCIKQLLESNVEFTEVPTYDGDLTKEHEKYITEVLYDNPVFVQQYPKNIKAFYMPEIKNESDENKRVDCFDLLFPYVGEVVGGSQRIDDYNTLKSRMEEKNIELEPLNWYLDLRKYGSVPHGGAGLGMGRLMIVITAIFNIKDMQEFPRGYGMTCHG
jgi:asparaginyl-tRNA synthetase